jgi:hypothetical protein
MSDKIGKLLWFVEYNWSDIYLQPKKQITLSCKYRIDKIMQIEDWN